MIKFATDNIKAAIIGSLLTFVLGIVWYAIENYLDERPELEATIIHNVFRVPQENLKDNIEDLIKSNSENGKKSNELTETTQNIALSKYNLLEMDIFHYNSYLQIELFNPTNKKVLNPTIKLFDTLGFQKTNSYFRYGKISVVGNEYVIPELMPNERIEVEVWTTKSFYKYPEHWEILISHNDGIASISHKSPVIETNYIKIFMLVAMVSMALIPLKLVMDVFYFSKRKIK